MVAADLLNILRCPQTQQTLAWADADLLAQIRSRQADHPDGTIDAAVVRSDGAVAYPVRDDIPVLLAEEAIPL